MAKPGQSSFRRILLSRLLLLSVPVLLIGVYVTYRKARSALLETARQNLTESAVRKSESIHQSLEALRVNLVTASDSIVLQLGSRSEKQNFLEQLTQKLPTEIQCMQLTNLQTGEIVNSTCGDQILGSIPANLWSQQESQLPLEPSNVYVRTLLPSNQQAGTQKKTNFSQSPSQLELLFSAPIYDRAGKVRHALSVKSVLLEQEQVKPGSLTGYPVVINQQGTILAHPLSKRVGRNIEQEADAERLKSLMRNALTNQPNFIHLFSFEENGVELLAGYAAIPSPVTAEQKSRWVILSVTRLDNALSDLKEIRQVLFIMMFALIAASVLATLYISLELARPVEKLRDYALNEDHYSQIKGKIPQDFKIREFKQLAIALNGMVERLKTWAEELETAWKEAQTANQLKNEFLATTSHELRTPLNGIIGCIRLIRDECCDDREEEMEFLQRADEAAVHLLGIINDVLNIAKIEAGKLSVTIEPVDLGKLLTEVIDLQVVPARSKGLEFIIPDQHKELVVRADPAKLKQVFINVIGNAVKFTESGSISVSIHTASVTHSSSNHDGRGEKKGEKFTPTLLGQRVVIMVQDTGIGIDPTQQEKLFRPFVMVDASTTRKFGGTGLGLAISRNLMELMGGEITLWSSGEGKGTTVEISLPLAEVSGLAQKSLVVREETTSQN